MGLISKKELLKETGISYGQLYRWKREGLIPEDWFKKQSAYTGQETFFERELILPRVEAIMRLKETRSLEEIRRIFGGAYEKDCTAADMAASAGLSEEVRGALARAVGDGFADIDDIAAASTLERGLGPGRAAEVLSELAAERPWRAGACCTVFRAGGGLYAAFTPGGDAPVFGGGAETVLSERLDITAERIKSNIEKGDR